MSDFRKVLFCRPCLYLTIAVPSLRHLRIIEQSAIPGYVKKGSWAALLHVIKGDRYFSDLSCNIHPISQKLSDRFCLNVGLPNKKAFARSKLSEQFQPL